MTISTLYMLRFVCLLGVLMLPVWSFGQYPQPTSLTVSPSTVYRPGWYSLCAGNGADMTLDLQYTFSGGGGGPIYDWPSLDANGCAAIYADSATPLGTFTYTAAKNTLNADWVSFYASVTIALPPPDFSVSATPGSQSVAFGGSAAFTVSVTGQNGFSGSVLLSASGLPAGASASFNPASISAGESSTMTVLTSSQTVGAYGSFTVSVAGSGGGWTRNTSVQLSVSPPPQPNSISFNPATGSAGNTPCTVARFANSPNMFVDVQYTLEGRSLSGSMQLDGNGEWRYCPGHNDATGTYTYSAMKNHLRTEWVSVSGVTYTVYPPKPTSLSLSPNTVIAGAGSYTMTVGNGGNVLPVLQYKLNEGATITLPPWPALDSSGSAVIPIDHCTPPGTYRYVAVKNSLNGDDTYLAVSTPLTVITTPSVSSLSQSSAARSWSGTLTINGRNLCDASLSTAWPGLTFSNVVSSKASVIATFTIAPNAWVGAAPITLATPYGSLGFNFTVTNGATPIITAVSPSTAMPGTSPSVTISGANLTGAGLSTSWSGLTFSNVSSDAQGASLVAAFTIAAGAPAGTPTIQVANSVGATNTQLFSIVSSAPQPGLLTFNPTTGYAGNTPCTVATFANSPSMFVDVQYTFQGASLSGSIQLDGNGQWNYCPGHNDATGSYTYTAMKNHSRPDWVSVSGVTYTVYPPRPTSLSLSPNTVIGGAGSYTMTVGNGGNVLPVFQYVLNEGATLTLPPWPALDSSGSAVIPVDHCTPPGTYRYAAMKNSLNSDDTYVPTSASVTVTSTPTLTSISPPNGSRGWSGTVMMNGRNLCGVSLSTTYSGLTVSNVTSNGSSATATFTVASNAPPGTAKIMLTASYGSTPFDFLIKSNLAPLITGMSPTTGVRGMAVTVTLTGSNLDGATLSTTWAGLTFTNVSSASDGSSITAEFNVAANAQLGTPTIQVSKVALSTTTQLFSIVGGPVLTKEYIRLGRRIIAVEGP